MRNYRISKEAEMKLLQLAMISRNNCHGFLAKTVARYQCLFYFEIVRQNWRLPRPADPQDVHCGVFNDKQRSVNPAAAGSEQDLTNVQF